MLNAQYPFQIHSHERLIFKESARSMPIHPRGLPRADSSPVADNLHQAVDVVQLDIALLHRDEAGALEA